MSVAKREGPAARDDIPAGERTVRSESNTCQRLPPFLTQTVSRHCAAADLKVGHLMELSRSAFDPEQSDRQQTPRAGKHDHDLVEGIAAPV